jgi:CDP-diacylglycerol--serine O-phosphatidyltransferase
MRALIPNAITALALCSGLTGIRYAISGEWERAALAILFAAVFDVLDGRVARMLKGTSRFGAELDSLSDVVAFGVAPALIMFLWSLQIMPRFGWLAALAHAVSCALRLARFNAQLDAEELPYKQAGFLTGIPAPGGAGIALIPLFVWLAARNWPEVMVAQSIAHSPIIVSALLILSAFLMIANLPSWSWKALRIPARWRLVFLLVVVFIFVELLTQTWETLSVIAIGYTLLIPLAWWRYAQIKARRVELTVH